MDVITYVSDLKLFREEAATVYANKLHPANKYLSKDVDGTMLFKNNGFPVFYGDNKSLCLIKTDTPEDLESLEYLEVIGECISGEYKFKAYGKDKYESTRNTKPVKIDDGEGGVMTYTPPYMIGLYI